MTTLTERSPAETEGVHAERTGRVVGAGLPASRHRM